MFRLAVVLALVAMFMDPCDKKPRNIELSEVGKACESEAMRMFVRVRGRLQPVPEIICKDHPGGRRCHAAIGSGSGEYITPVLIKGTERRDGRLRYESTLVAPKGTSDGGIGPYSVGFRDAQLYDRDGNIVDYVNGEVDLSGSLHPDSESGICTLLVLRVGGK